MIRSEIEKILNTASERAGYGQELKVTYSLVPKLCDYQCNGCFALAKKFGKNPLEIAENIVKNIEKNENFEFFVAKPAFINIKLSNSYMSDCAKKINDGSIAPENIGNGRTIFLDYGGPNIGKAMHIGHIRSFNIGEAMKRLYRKLGFNVICDIFFGDWGMPLGLIIAQLEEDGVLNYYFKHKGTKPILTLEMMNIAYPKASIRKGEDPKFKAKAEEYTLKFQRGDEPYHSIWEQLREVSIAAVKKICQRLNTDFDLWNGESTASSYVDTVIDIFKKKHLARISEGALVVDVAQEGEQIPIPKKSPDEIQRYENPMPPLMLQKSNGGEVYSTSDIATIYYRNKLYKPDIIQYFTDNRQLQRFVQIFRACKKAGISPKEQQLIHTTFGTVNGKDGKPFKTREGGTLKLEDFINSLVLAAEEKLKQNGVTDDDDLAIKVAIGALKFGDLYTTIEKDYIFDVDKFLSFEGKTGPYIQYTICRIRSILDKSGMDGADIKIESEDERNIIMCALKLLSAYRICFEERSLSSLCSATYDLASAFSTFYNSTHILSEKDEARKKSYLSLLTLVKKLLTEALDTLAIDVPKKM